jgi:hypothetical protein
MLEFYEMPTVPKRGSVLRTCVLADLGLVGVQLGLENPAAYATTKACDDRQNDCRDKEGGNDARKNELD